MCTKGCPKPVKDHVATLLQILLVGHGVCVMGLGIREDYVILLCLPVYCWQVKRIDVALSWQ